MTIELIRTGPSEDFYFTMIKFAKTARVTLVANLAERSLPSCTSDKYEIINKLFQQLASFADKPKLRQGRTPSSNSRHNETVARRTPSFPAEQSDALLRGAIQIRDFYLALE